MSEIDQRVEPKEVLSSSVVFGELDERQLTDLVRLTTPFYYNAGEQLFAHGDTADYVYILGSGQLEAVRYLPGGHEEKLALIGPGETVGEIALIEGQRRYATVRAIEPTTGVKISRHGFDSLRFGMGESSMIIMRRMSDYLIDLLHDFYNDVLEKVGGGSDGKPTQQGEFSPPRPILEKFTEEEKEYLLRTPFFNDMDPQELDELLAETPRVHLERGQLLVPLDAQTDAFYVVMFGVVESTLRHAGLTQRVRLAGPGAAPTYLSLSEDAPASPVMCRTRERTIALTLTKDHYAQLVNGSSILSQRFLSALQLDLVSAIKDANRATAWCLIAEPPNIEPPAL